MKPASVLFVALFVSHAYGQNAVQKGSAEAELLRDRQMAEHQMWLSRFKSAMRPKLLNTIDTPDTAAVRLEELASEKISGRMMAGAGLVLPTTVGEVTAYPNVLKVAKTRGTDKIFVRLPSGKVSLIVGYSARDLSPDQEISFSEPLYGLKVTETVEFGDVLEIRPLDWNDTIEKVAAQAAANKQDYWYQWEAVEGQKATAKFVKLDKGQVTLRRTDESLITVKIMTMSESDRKQVRRFVAYRKKEEQAAKRERFGR